MSHKLKELDGLRAASIVLVLACHMLPLGPKWLGLNEAAGAAGMAIFFSLSGFLITGNLLSGQSVPTFLLRRGARILPLAYLYLVVAIALTGASTQQISDNALFIENYTHDWIADGHFWSLCVEMHFYLAIAVVALAGRSSLVALTVPVACIVITFIRIFNGAYIDIQTHLRVDEICSGACIAIGYHRIGFSEQRLALPVFCIAAAALMVSSHPSVNGLQYARPYFAAISLASAMCLKDNRFRRLLRSRSAAYVAEISYALYVIHPLTMYGPLGTGGSFVKYFGKRPLSFALTFALAHVSTRYYESYFIELAKRMTGGRQNIERKPDRCITSASTAREFR